MTDAGLGQSTCVGIGGDPIIGTTFLDVLQLFAADDETDAIVLIGEIGGAAEETAAAWAAEHLRDIPKVAFIAGRTAPEGKRMGHAGAIISGGAGTAASKVEALEAAGFRVAGSPTELPGAPPRRRLPRLDADGAWARMDLVAGDAREILLVIGTDDLAALDDREPVRRPPRARRRARPDLAGPVLRGGPDRDRLPRPERLPRCPARARRARTRGRRAHDRAGRSRLDHGRRPASRTAPSTPSPAAGSTSSRRSSAMLPREEKPWIRDLAGPGRRVLPRRRPRAGRRCSPGRSDDAATARNPRPIVRGQPLAVGRLDRGSTPRATSTTSTASRRAASGSAPYEIEIVGDVAGKTLLHLQCHFGIDTLSWARLGARVTGADFSPAAVELAATLAADLGFPEARFVESNVYDLPANLDGDVRHRLHVARRARLAARHPRAGRGSSRTSSRRAASSSSPRPTRSSRPSRTRASAPASCASTTRTGSTPTARLPGQGLVRRPGRRRRRPDRARLGPRPRRDRHRADRAGLRIEALVEHPFLAWSADFLVERTPDDVGAAGPSVKGELPLMFSLRATKPLA